MAIINTSNTIDISIFLKAKLKDNMVGDNYYIENAQAKRNRDWDFRFNRVDIEEEGDKAVAYTNEFPSYNLIDVVINNVKDDQGEDLGTDWAKISFRELKHPADIGDRYRFNIKAFTDDEPIKGIDYNKSVWICTNRSPLSAGNSSILRRCNQFLTFVGSPNLNPGNITEYHLEPCVVETEMKYVQLYTNLTVPVPQAEYYVTMQCNYFTNCVKTNDRFIFGSGDLSNRENNYAYKVKAVVRSTCGVTFVKNQQELLENTNLVVLALDRDLISPDDKFDFSIGNESNADNIYRVASCAPIYKVEEEIPVAGENTCDLFEYDIESNTEGSKVTKSDIGIIQGDTCGYKIVVMNGGQPVSPQPQVIVDCYGLSSITPERQSMYYEFTHLGNNIFTVKNKKQCKSSKLKIKLIYNSSSGNNVDETIYIKLSGFY